MEAQLLSPAAAASLYCSFLPELPLALEEAGYELGMVQDLLAHTDGEYAAAIRALQATGSDMHAAVQLIKRQRQTAETVSCALLEAKEADDEFELVSPPSPSSPPDTPSTPPATSAAAESDSSAASSQTPTAALSHVQVVAADDDEKPAAPLAAASKTEGESDDEELWIDEEVQAAPLSVHARLRVGDSTASTVPMGWPSEYQVVTRKEQSVISGVLAGPGFACTPFMAKRALELSDDIVSAAVQLVLDMRQLLQDEESMAATATDFRQIIDHPPPPQHAVSSPASAIAVAAPVSALVAAPAASVSSTDLVLIPSDEQELLRLLSPHNLLVRLLSFTWRQVQQLPSSCANCGAALHPGLSMRSCGLATCKLSIDSSGVDTDVIDYMRRAPAVSDLLISMLAAAASDQQLPAAVAPLMFSVRDPEFCYVDSFASEHSPGRLDYLRLQHSISQLQSLPVMLSDVSSLGEEEFVSKTNSLDLLIIPLLRWLFLSCPAHLRLLETGAHYQYPVPLVALFACLLNSPEQERAFQQRKAAASGRSCLAYYTAPAAQWHTKLRLGLTARTANGGVVESRPDDTVLLSLQPPEVTDFFPCAWQRSYLTQWPAFVCEVEVLESARRLPGSPGHVAARQEDFSSRRLLILAHSTAAGSNVFALRRCGSSSSSSSPSLASPAPVDESSSPPPGYKPLPQHEIRTGWDD